MSEEHLKALKDRVPAYVTGIIDEAYQLGRAGAGSEADLRELAVRDHDGFLTELDRRVAAWLERISSRTPAGDAELAEFIRRAMADPELHDEPEAGQKAVTEPAWVLNLMIEQIATAPADVRACLEHCLLCRNRLLYVLDTAPYDPGYATGSAGVIGRRLAALPDDHRFSHCGAGDSDLNPPRIRWAAS